MKGWLRRLFGRSAEWQEEIDSHLEMRREWLEDRGKPGEEARAEARRQFGSPLAAAEEVRAVHIGQWIESTWQDIRYAARSFRRSPGFTAVACLTVAIGVGASTAVFSLIDPLLFRHLPYPKDEQLVSLGYLGPIDTNEFNVVSSYLDWSKNQQPFQAMTSMRPGGHCDFVAGEVPLRIDCIRVEANFLGTFGVRVLLGRDFTAEDDRPQSAGVALLSYELWQRVYGGSASALGKTVTVDDRTARIIGVLPESFEMPQLGHADLILP